MSLRLAVTGSKGQLVTSLLERGAGSDFEVIALGRPQLDLKEPDSIRRAMAAAMPAAIVSAAAYTAVDKAESESALAQAINGDGAGLVAFAAAELGVPVIHISTDYVFDGRKPTPYVESDATQPLGAYGASKLAGERAVAQTTVNYAILRTAWVYSPFGGNFLKTMLRLAGDRDELRVVADQVGNPTSALDLADAVLAVARNLIRSEDATLRGIFHATGSGETSWAGFASEILAASARERGPTARVTPISTAEYPTPAARPANSRLETRRLEDAHGFVFPDWTVSTSAIVQRLLNEQAIATKKAI